MGVFLLRMIILLNTFNLYYGINEYRISLFDQTNWDTIWLYKLREYKT